MKRSIARVIVLLLSSVLLSCGGGGDGGSGGGSGTPANSAPGGDPGAPVGGNPGNDGNGGTLPPAAARVEESDAAVSLSAGWTPADAKYGWSGGTAVQSATVGATASFTFTGTSVRWIGALNRDGGIARVRVDGGQTLGRDMFEVDLFTRPREARVPVLTLNDLGAGQHTLTIEVTGLKNPSANSSVVVIDAFDIEPQIVSHLQETDPHVTLSGDWQHDPSSDFSGGGVHTSDEEINGGARYTATAGATATLKFRGTSIAWSAYRGPDAGIARVKLDGGEATEIDLYSPTKKYQGEVFKVAGLPELTGDGKLHTLTIEVTGARNPAATGAKVAVDSFDVTTPGTRYQERPYQKRDRDAFRYTTATSMPWEGRRSRPWSEGYSIVSSRLGNAVFFSFTGTSVSWIGCRKLSCSGRAKIYLDGVLEKEVNAREPSPIEGFQHTMHRIDGLTNGPHLLKIEVVSTGGYIVVDAFDVHDGKALPIADNPLRHMVDGSTGGDAGTPTEGSTGP